MRGIGHANQGGRASHPPPPVCARTHPRLARARPLTRAVGHVLQPAELREHQLGDGHARVRGGALELLLVLGQDLQQVAGERGLDVGALKQQAHHAVLDAAVAVKGRGRAATGAAGLWCPRRLQCGTQALRVRPCVGEIGDELLSDVRAPLASVIHPLAKEEGICQLVGPVDCARQPVGGQECTRDRWRDRRRGLGRARGLLGDSVLHGHLRGRVFARWTAARHAAWGWFFSAMVWLLWSPTLQARAPDSAGE